MSTLVSLKLILMMSISELFHFANDRIFLCTPQLCSAVSAIIFPVVNKLNSARSLRLCLQCWQISARSKPNSGPTYLLKASYKYFIWVGSFTVALTLEMIFCSELLKFWLKQLELTLLIYLLLFFSPFFFTLSKKILVVFVRYALPSCSPIKVIGISGRKKIKSTKAHVAFLKIKAGYGQAWLEVDCMRIAFSGKNL